MVIHIRLGRGIREAPLTLAKNPMVMLKGLLHIQSQDHTSSSLPSLCSQSELGWTVHSSPQSSELSLHMQPGKCQHITCPWDKCCHLPTG